MVINKCGHKCPYMSALFCCMNSSHHVNNIIFCVEEVKEKTHVNRAYTICFSFTLVKSTNKYFNLLALFNRVHFYYLAVKMNSCEI
jgi:hypothetical protein